MSSLRLPGLRAFGLLTVFLLCAFSARAHELRPAVADVSVDQAGTVSVSIRANLEALISEIGPEHSDSDDAPQAQRYKQLRAMPPEALEAEFQEYLGEFLQEVSLTSGTGQALSLTVGSLTIPPVEDERLPRDTTLVLQSEGNASAQSVSWHWNRQYGAIILRSEPLVASDAQTEREGFSQYLQAGDTSEQIGLAAGAEQSHGSSFIDYIVIGFEHIIPKGLDHILFVIGLFLLAPRLKPIIWQTSMFTIAHTITLALGITGIIVLPASIVEPLIALSITIVCVENLFGSTHSKIRLAIVFGFGLLHGLGFAGVLSEIGLVSGRFVSSLLAFNIGVELGQLAVVLLCFATVGWWFGNKPWYRKVITIPASLVIGAIGLYWFFERVGVIA